MMVRFVSILFCVFYIDQVTSSGLGKCPKLELMENFNLTRFTGRWYEIERSFYLAQIISNCISVDLMINSKGHVEVDVKSRSRWSGTFTVSQGIAVTQKRGPSIFGYKVITELPRILSRYLPGAGTYQVIDTDYRNYAILWSCTNYGLAHTDLIWIWGRQPEINEDRRIEIYETLDELNLDSERLILPKNTNCTQT